MSSPSTGSVAIESNAASNDVSESLVALAKAGRPKGSTTQKKREDMKNYKECLNSITDSYHNELTLHKNQNKRLVKGFLEQLILQSLVLAAIFLWKQ